MLGLSTERLVGSRCCRIGAVLAAKSVVEVVCTDAEWVTCLDMKFVVLSCLEGLSANGTLSFVSLTRLLGSAPQA